jgi:hypothetical protein
MTTKRLLWMVGLACAVLWSGCDSGEKAQHSAGSYEGGKAETSQPGAITGELEGKIDETVEAVKTTAQESVEAVKDKTQEYVEKGAQKTQEAVEMGTEKTAKVEEDVKQTTDGYIQDIHKEAGKITEDADKKVTDLYK